MFCLHAAACGQLFVDCRLLIFGKTKAEMVDALGKRPTSGKQGEIHITVSQPDIAAIAAAP